MANEQNLKPFDQRTESEQREIRKKGGIASGQARRKKKEFATIIEQALNAEIPSQDAQKKLEKMGFDPTFQSAIALKVVELATKGNLRAVEVLAEFTTKKKDALDRKEQKQRIKALELENARRERELADNNDSEDSLREYFEGLEEIK